MKEIMISKAKYFNVSITYVIFSKCISFLCLILYFLHLAVNDKQIILQNTQIILSIVAAQFDITIIFNIKCI